MKLIKKIFDILKLSFSGWVHYVTRRLSHYSLNFTTEGLSKRILDKQLVAGKKDQQLYDDLEESFPGFSDSLKSRNLTIDSDNNQIVDCYIRCTVVVSNFENYNDWLSNCHKNKYFKDIKLENDKLWNKITLLSRIRGLSRNIDPVYGLVLLGNIAINIAFIPLFTATMILVTSLEMLRTIIIHPFSKDESAQSNKSEAQQNKNALNENENIINKTEKNLNTGKSLVFSDVKKHKDDAKSDKSSVPDAKPNSINKIYIIAKTMAINTLSLKHL